MNPENLPRRLIVIVGALVTISPPNNIIRYFWGKGVAVDYAQALPAYKIAAEGGDAHSQFQLGLAYKNGQGVEVCFEQAVKVNLICRVSPPQAAAVP